MGHVLAIRSENQSLFKIGLFSIKPLIAAVVIAILLQFAVTYTPFLQPIFKTESLTLKEFVVVIVASILVFFVVEIEKAIFRKRGRKKKVTAGF